jgi:ubiquitin-like-conjugating enzyme ATG3
MEHNTEMEAIVEDDQDGGWVDTHHHLSAEQKLEDEAVDVTKVTPASARAGADGDDDDNDDDEEAVDAEDFEGCEDDDDEQVTTVFRPDP